MTEQPQEHRVEITVPPDHEVGVYAGFASVWRTQDSFVIDFSTAVRPPEMMEDEGGTPYIHVPAQVVSRVRIPPSQVWELMKVLEQNLSAYERESGKSAHDDD
ncbi:DUF3467 domain-containing protein [Actinoallomurus purpureus]|uniref:DUF3467 domain-containing protein n=1 Tax=Actinoallomurus purpureus TaxID=478114 RepID=UPI0020935015|nr:DUF3467 domain-containing protein [Actinoallomurus purpureus]MCO6007827.1 DUF3467 domain-containing protein [Actinoallomurus purpureus]